MNRTDHLLWILAEECAEVAQRASKAARFSLKEAQPDQPYTNAERIMHEYTDLMAAIEMLIDEGHLKFPGDIFQRVEKKKAQVEKFLPVA